MSKKKRKKQIRPSESRSPLPPCPEFDRVPGAPFPEEVREHALLLVASGIKRVEVARRIGTTTETLRQWVKKAEAAGSMPTPPVAKSSSVSKKGKTKAAPAVPQRAPKDPGKGLGAHEEEAILTLKKRHPSMGPAQIRAQLKRFKGWRLSTRAIGRVLKKHGFELVHRGSRPKDEEDFVRFEAPWRNALWQMDFAELRVGAERRALLLIEDDYSRFLVGHALIEDPSSEDVVSVLTRAFRRHGKPEAVYTDRGGPFLAWRKPSSLGRFLDEHLVDHHVSPAYRPRGRGKIESLVGTVKRELWEVCEFGSVLEAEKALASFARRYNHLRAHMGIDGLTPADRYFGRADEVLERVQAASRRRQGALARGAGGGGGDPFVTEEVLPDGPFEVLRLLIEEGRMILTFFGHRVDLGEVRS